jgi:hypothetical protein
MATRIAAKNMREWQCVIEQQVRAMAISCAKMDIPASRIVINMTHKEFIEKNEIVRTL